MSAALPAGVTGRHELTALTWTAPGHERSVLLAEPANCPDPAQLSDEATIGKALFNAPDLLGGQAQRASVSCATCHSNGRRNSAFFLGGISSSPGSADVSSGFFSTARANDLFDPKPIPDLALPGKIDRNPASSSLKTFIRGLVVEEFSGREPNAGQLKALAAYVRSVRACPGTAVSPIDLNRDLALVRTSIAAAVLLADRGDITGAQVAAKSARYHLGLIDERFPGRPAAHRVLLTAASDLARVPLNAALSDWLRRFERGVVPSLKRDSPRSLYDPATLDRWLGRR